MGTLGALLLTLYIVTATTSAETVLSSVLTPQAKTPKPSLQRQARSYYDQRYGLPRPLYERLEYDRPSRCGRCQEDRYDYDRPRDVGYDDDRRIHRPTYGNRYDRNRPYDRDDSQDRDRYGERRPTERKNGTNDPNETDDNKKRFDDRDNDRMSQGNRNRLDDVDRNRYNDRDRNRYDERDRYRPDYYDRFLRDPYREDPYLSDPYRERERRPIEAYPGYERYDEELALRGRRPEAYGGYRRAQYDDRGNGYDDLGYGSYSPALGRGPHDSFRPWDETYRGQAGWDDGGRGYYFAGGRPDAGAAGWGRPEYTRVDSQSGWQNVGYGRDPYDHRAAAADPYRERDAYRPAGWHSVNERRPYRDQTGVNQDRNTYRQTTRPEPASYGQNNNRGATYPQTGNSASTTTTTPGNSYLYEREDTSVTTRTADTTNKTTS